MTTQRRGRLLGERRATQVHDTRPLVLLPVGSVRDHGAHLPLRTDGLVAESVAREAAALLGGESRPVLVAPTLAFGCDEAAEVRSRAGEVSVSPVVLQALVVDVCVSTMRWARGVVLVNGFAGNEAAVGGAVRTLRDDDLPVTWAQCCLPAGQAHAGRAETALVMALAPWLARPDLVPDGPDAVALEGVSAEEGRAVLRTLVARLALAVRADRNDGAGMLVHVPPSPAPAPAVENLDVLVATGV